MLHQLSHAVHLGLYPDVSLWEVGEVLEAVVGVVVHALLEAFVEHQNVKRET